MAEVCCGMGWLWWAKVAGAVGSSAVVVANIFGEYCTQVALVDDQHAVGQFGSQGADEPFGEAVRSWAPGRNADYLDAHIGQDGVERGGELAGPVADEESELGDAVIEVHHEVADLLGGPSAVGVGGRAQQVHGPIANLQHEEYVDPLEYHRAVNVEEVAGQHRGCLGAQELPPGCVSAPGRRRRNPQALEDATDGRGSYAVAEFEQLALDSLVPQL